MMRRESELLALLDEHDRAFVVRFARAFDGRIVAIRKGDGSLVRGESTPVRFLRALFQPGDGYIDLRAIDRDKNVKHRFVPADRPERVHEFINQNPSSNIY